MGASPDIASSLRTIPHKKDLLRKAFDELEVQQAIIVRCTSEWKELEEHFSAIEAALQKRFDEIVEKEKAFEAKMRESQAALEKRDGAVSVREQASLARVQEQKDAAIAAIMEQKRKLNEERQRLGSDHAAKAVDEVVDTKVESKQVIDTAEKESVVQAMDVEAGGSKPDEEADAGDERKDASQDKKEAPDAPKPSVTARPQLKSLCENMDGAGLRKYVAEQRKEINALRAELPSALRCAIDPARVVLKALEGYYSTDLAPVQGKKKEAGPLPSNRRACILLLEALADVLADPLLGTDHAVVPSNIKVSAKEVAELWKSNLNLEGTDAVAMLLDAQSFLQLLATFGLASEFDEDELCKLASLISRRKQTPALCRSLGLAAKVPDLVEKLIKDGKQIEALSFAHEFGLFEQFPPVPLLKSYLKEARKSAQAILKNGNQSPAAQNEHLTKEVSALRAVLKCIDEYKLEGEYPRQSLQKRVAQLEKTKFEKKRTADAAKIQSKKPRANGAGGGPLGGSAFRPSDRPQYAGGGVSSYGLPARNYGSGYGTDPRSPHSLAGAYSYPADGLGSLYGNPSFSYGTYQYGAGPASTYQGSFLR